MKQMLFSHEANTIGTVLGVVAIGSFLTGLAAAKNEGLNARNLRPNAELARNTLGLLVLFTLPGFAAQKPENSLLGAILITSLSFGMYIGAKFNRQNNQNVNRNNNLSSATNKLSFS